MDNIVKKDNELLDALVEYVGELLDVGDIEETYESVFDAIVAAGHNEAIATAVADEVSAYHEW